MNRRARSGSTGFQVMPSTLRLVPTITPSATARVSASRSAVTPVFASTGVSGAACLAAHPALVMQGNSANFWWIPAWFAGLIVAGCLLYYIPRYIRARRGINVSFVYKELPPE